MMIITKDLTLRQSNQLIYELREMGYDAHYKARIIIDAEGNRILTAGIEILNK